MNKPGIALIIVIMSLSAFMLATCALYRAALLLPRFVQNEIIHQKNELLLDSALIYAIAFCRENWHQLAQQARQGKKQEIFRLPLPDGKTQADIVIILGTEEQHIMARLIHINEANKKSMHARAIMYNDLSITHL